MIPEYLIIEEERRRSQEQSLQLPLYAPQPEYDRMPEARSEEEEEKPGSNVVIIDLSSYSETSL